MNKFILTLITTLLWSSAYLFAQPLSPTTEMIAVRDGKQLAADVYINPNCNSCPTILIQTPYNKNFYRWGLPLGIGVNLQDYNYQFVIVDWRGFYGSAAAFDNNAEQGEDGYDIIEWIVSQPWSDGQVGTWGPSALARVQYNTAREQHPNHICAVPLVAGSQFNYEDYYTGGVYKKEYVEQLDALGFGLSTIILNNPVKNFTWNFVENQNYYPNEIKIPMYIIGGWYDHATNNIIDLFKGLKSQSPQQVRDKHKLLIGPWAHGGMGQVQVGTEQQGELFFPDAAGWSDSLALMFFDYHLHQINNGFDSEPEIRYFIPGSMTWEGTTDWPPTGYNPTKLYLNENNRLIGSANLPNSAMSSISYDPNDPSPTIGGPTLSQSLLQGPYDQSTEVETRDDVLIFSTHTLSQPVTMVGKTNIKLFVSSNKKDTDFAVRLCDVYPDGKSILLMDGIRRLRFRNGYTASDTALAVPGEIYEIDIELPHLVHTFLEGHQIRLIVSSSNYPRFDKNLNNGGSMYVPGVALIAENTIYHESDHPSHIELLLNQFPVSNQTIDKKLVSLNLYPNPVSNRLTVESELIIKHYQIYSLDGRLVNSEENVNQSTIEINTQNIPKGVYIIKLSAEKGEVVTRKFIRL
jgi:uncharacterized protein